MTSSPLSQFIAHARSKNMDHQTIRMLLLSAGWKEKDIAAALASESLSMPVPTPTDAGSARDAFFHLLSFTSLISTVVSLIVLLYQYWNLLFPDAAFPDYYYGMESVRSTIRWSLASIFVSFPLFLWMMRLLYREMTMHPEKLASGVRRWLTYLILFVTACTLTGDLITVIFSLLQGELTIRFILKALTIFVLCGLPFLYYFRTLRLDADSYSKSVAHMRYFWLSVAIVVLSVLMGFYIAGSPAYGRSQRFDEVRVNDLRSIQNEIANITLPTPPNTPPPYTLQKPLPPNLDEVAAQAQYQRPNIADPETGAPYTYKVTSDHTYQLCATFDLERSQQYDIFWDHPSGEHCYSFDASQGQRK